MKFKTTAKEAPMTNHPPRFAIGEHVSIRDFIPGRGHVTFPGVVVQAKIVAPEDRVWHGAEYGGRHVKKGKPA